MFQGLYRSITHFRLIFFNGDNLTEIMDKVYAFYFILQAKGFIPSPLDIVYLLRFSHLDRKDMAVYNNYYAF